MTQTPIQIATNLAAEYVACRWEIEKHEARRRELEPIVAEWCKKQITPERGNKKIAYTCPDSKAQLIIKHVKDESVIKNHPDIQCLDELIQLQREQANYQNQKAIAIINDQVAKLQQQLALLQETPESIRLVVEREELAAELRKQPEYLKSQVAFKIGF